jgi:hypothetical protein
MTLEITEEVYNSLAGNLRIAVSAAGLARSMLPKYISDPLSDSLDEALKAMGEIVVPPNRKDEVEGDDDPVARHNALMDRSHDEKVDRELEERA